MDNIYLQKRTQILRALRDFFAQKGFDEVDTPIMQISPGLEIHQVAFETHLIEPFGQQTGVRYLHTSPEFAMKKLLARGMDKIYQVCHTFRNEERGPCHSPEFLMLEFYQTHADYNTLMDLTEELIRHCAKSVGTEEVFFGDKTCFLTGPWERLTVAQAFLRYAAIDLMATLPDTPTDEPDPTLLREQAVLQGISCNENDRWEDIFFRIMLEKVEPHLGDKKPTLLYDYPICLGALARAKPTNPLIAERVEVYIAGVELGNGYSELLDADVYLSRFHYVQKMQQLLYHRQYPIDDDFIAAMRRGMPPCTGIAIGMDRLFMLLSHAPDIASVQFIPCL